MLNSLSSGELQSVKMASILRCLQRPPAKLTASLASAILRTYDEYAVGNDPRQSLRSEKARFLKLAKNIQKYIRRDFK